jgi:hypothetical protein
LPFTQVILPAHSFTVAPPPASDSPHKSVQPASALQVHFESPEHFTVQPPSAQVTLQVEVPTHSSVELGCSVTLQVLPPPQLTVELAPVVTVHAEVPVHCAVELSPMFWVQVLFDAQEVSQLLPQVPVQVVSWAQCEVQSVPQVTLQVLFLLQSKVTPLGAALGSPPPSVGWPSPPRVQVCPDWQVQVVSLQLQAPEHCSLGLPQLQA